MTAELPDARTLTDDDLFAPPTGEWKRLSPNYLRMKRMLIPTVWGVLFLIPAVILAVTKLWWALAILVPVALVWIGWRLWRAPRVYARWGYAERDEDIYLTSGLWSRSLSCVPYGRMQLVEVSQGPIERAYGLSTVQLVTSSTSGTVIIPGLDRGDATALRDRLIAAGEQQQAGI
ncbi:PH domain-containing protein [Tessaracoccus defluvii]|uniref:PH domain-containing protein n=1 Tax=Tessaracoccus defluvii TaxID=1285901 RepID=A0A7H0H5H8_9ACTN|nr:PH domain-containing protein [Tessaracoccus defluvii]QNP55794.1 PH domain-containing protein [Tessaracoccus defluvii]